jgi:hypothetical protein
MYITMVPEYRPDKAEREKILTKQSVLAHKVGSTPYPRLVTGTKSD